MPWPKTGATHYQAQLGVPDKGRAICQTVGCLLLYVVVWLGSMIYGMGLWTSAKCVVWSLVVVRMAIELKYHNTPQIHITSNISEKTQLNKNRILQKSVKKNLPKPYVCKLERCCAFARKVVSTETKAAGSVCVCECVCMSVCACMYSKSDK